MFYPESMTEIELIVPSKDLLEVTKVLGGQGVFQQTDSNYLSAEKELKTPNTWQVTATEYSGFERRILAVMQTLSMMESAPPANSFESLVDFEATRAIIQKVELEVKQTSDLLSAEHKHLEQLETALHQLEPVAKINLDISSLHSQRYLSMILGVVPVANVARLQTSLERIPNVFVNLQQDNQSAIVWIAGTQHNAPILERAARSAYLNPITLPEDYEGTPSQIIKELQASIIKAKQKIEQLKARLIEQHNAVQQQLQALLWDVRASRLMAETILRFGQLQYTYLIVGWVPSTRLPVLLEALQKISSQILIEAFPLKRDNSRSDVPVTLSDSPLLRPFQNLVTTYARPRYEEIDPTLLIAFTFPLLFGAMFGDVGHGLVLALAGWLLASKKVKALEGMSGLGGLIAVCGLVATVFGFLYGSIFGMEGVIPALWLHPMEHIMQILGVAIGAGIALLSTGFLVGMFNAWVSRDLGRLFFDHNGLAGFVLYWSLIGLVAGLFLKDLSLPSALFVVLAVISGLLVMFSEVLKHLLIGHRPLIESGMGTYAIQAFFELFETLIGFLSNSLSYVRVGAFAVAHAGLSAVVFILAEMVSPAHGIGYWLVVALGNLFIIGFEGLIVGIQTMRLEYYEFFSKFFTGGGSRYEPLTLHPVTGK